ncbi:MAG TPA: 2-oxoglutarate dehydrogenase E1 component [Candidatus Sulfotelmatobacter sp.]|nr:2-oxoglutarate dehydrogenase E1 component [Candidatus Sulfotelmatobacter sp.]
MSSRLDFIQRANAGYIEKLYAEFLKDPASVPEEWALFFAGFDFAGSRPAAAGTPTAGVFGLVSAYREFGHRAARLDPLSTAAPSEPLLELSNFGLSEADLDSPVEPYPFRGEFSGTLRELIVELSETYCGPLGVEFMDIPNRRRREWLQERMEPNRNRPSLSRDERVAILRELMTADAFEQFLHVKYVGQKRFSLEGGATLIPMLETLVERSAARGIEQLVIGMPHRGRLNVLANVLHKPLESIFAEFETGAPEEAANHGDVKYHLGFASVRTTGGRNLALSMHYNPSHLEFVNPVVLGSVRARQEITGDAARERTVPLLIHGDAAFSGEGIVPETLSLAQLSPYWTGGALHIVVNNQVGFTTSPSDARHSRYATDIARIIEAPVFHVNGDEPEAAVHAMDLALAYRMEFKRDAIIDLICYRKHGHNELDDPTFTQPTMYAAIAKHEPASRRYARRLIDEGALDAAGLQAIESEIEATLQAAHARLRGGEVPRTAREPSGVWSGMRWDSEEWTADTRAPRSLLERIARDAARVPDGFQVHARVRRVLDDRVKMLEQDRVDWGGGEMLAIGSLLLEGEHVRLSGQDSGRGTFSHRHAVLHDSATGRRWTPLQHLGPGQGRFEVFDTPLSEAAPLGFEYGYSTADPHTLVIWEAQFGDFANVAQVYIDQFLASGEGKWRRMSGLTLLLPHGYEGQGPEHSSARLERFLELCADGNLQVVNLTTPAQLFHVLRRQQKRPYRRPLVVLSPKSLLRHRQAVSALRDFTDGEFHTLLDDPGVAAPDRVSSILLCSGRLFYTLLEARGTRGREDVALVRLEQLYPFPRLELTQLFQRYPQARDIRWVQEEPANMGAWRNTRHRLEGVLPQGATLYLVARKAAPTPASGSYPQHAEQEHQLIERAFRQGSPGAAPRAPRRVARASEGSGS